MDKERYCIICGQRQFGEQNIHFFKVPTDTNQRLSWIESCGKNLAVGTFVCSRHFPPEYVGRKKLKKGSLPSLCSFHAATTSPIPDITQNVPINSTSGFDEESCHSLFHLIMSGKMVIRLPSNWGLHKLKTHIVLSKIKMNESGSFEIDRSVAITENNIEARIHNKIISFESSIKTNTDLQKFISKVNTSNICEGKSNSCSVLLPENVSLCNSCSSYKYFLRMKNEGKKGQFSLKENRNRGYFTLNGEIDF